MRNIFRSGPSATVLLVTPSRIARVDFSGRQRIHVAGSWSQSLRPLANASDSLIVGTAQAIKLGPAPPGKVTLISPLFWTEVLRLPSDVLAISTPAQVRHALAIEAETELGFSAFDSEVVIQQLESDPNEGTPFCTTLVAPSQLIELMAIMRSHRIPLQRLAHPIALQLYEGQTSVQSVIDALTWWEERTAEDEGWIEDFANRIAPLLGNRKAKWPCCLHPTVGPKQGQVAAIGGFLAAVTLLGCYTWHQATRSRLDNTMNAVQQLEQKQAARAETVAAIKGLETKVVKLQKEADDARELREAVERQIQLATAIHWRQNARWSALADALAEICGDCWIQRINSDSHRTTLSGIALTNAEAHALAARLESILCDSGWIILPAATQEISAGLYEFHITLVPDNSDKGASPAAEDVVLRLEKGLSGGLPVAAAERIQP